MKKSNKTNQEHQKKAIELLSYLFLQEDFVKSNELLNQYNEKSERESMDSKDVQRCVQTLHELSDMEIIESKRGQGYRLKAEFRKNLNWMLPLFSRYLILTEPESLNYVFEPLVFQLEINSIGNLILLEKARIKRKTIRFEYTKYQQSKSEQRIMNVYSLVQRDNKLLVMGKDLKDNKYKHFIFTQITNIQTLEKTFELPDINTIKDYYKESISIYKSDEITKVKIRFSSDAKTFIYKEYFHHKQIITLDDKGNFILELYATKKDEIFNIVTQFIKYAELLEPIEWREELTLLLENSLRKHK